MFPLILANCNRLAPRLSPATDNSRPIPTLRHASHPLSLSDTLSTLLCQSIAFIDGINTITWELQLTFNLPVSNHLSDALLPLSSPFTLRCHVHASVLIPPFIATFGGGVRGPSISSTNTDR